jgi:glycosyltransferase involved in cell wall biosynthesis
MSDTPLVVGIDITPILYNRGVSRYTSNIIRALSKEDDLILRFFGSSFRQNKNLKHIGNTLAREMQMATKPTILSFPPAFLQRMWYGVGRLHLESLMPKVEVFHAWEELIPPTYKTPVVATIHDLALFKFPQLAHASTKEKHMAAYKKLRETGSHVIAVSQQTKRDCIELLDFDASKVHVVYEALPTESMIEPSLRMSREQLVKFGINKPYFLWVGTQEPRKNLKRAVEAWEKHAADFDFVIVGAAGTKEVTPRKGLKVLGTVSFIELASLYSHAQLLLFPSLYEGFGLPILEAFYYGCPVVTANNSGMAEVAGEAASLVDPYAVESIQEGIADSLKHGHSAARQKAMKKQANLFSWSKSAKATLEVYRQAKRDGLSTSK